MMFQSASGALVAQAGFRSVVHGVTGPVTVTATHGPALFIGEPAILSTATIGVGALGNEVIRCLTSTSVLNRLCVGVVASDSIAKEAVGLVQRGRPS